MPCGAASIASAVVIALTPPFAAAYGTRLMPRVALDETLTMVPAPASIMYGSTARQHHSVGNNERRTSASISSGPYS